MPLAEAVAGANFAFFTNVQTMDDSLKQVDAPPPRDERPDVTPLQFRLAHLFWFTAWFAGLCGACTIGGLGLGLIFVSVSLFVVGLVNRGLRIGVWILGVMLFLVGISVIEETVRYTHPRRASCMNQLKQIVLALQHYEAVHGCFPPACRTDAKGKPMHSWRVLILPYLELKPLYDTYRFDEPWDGPNNRKLAKPLSLYQCPSASDKERTAGMTNYVAVVGPGTMWDKPQGVKQSDVADGLSNTILVVELADSDIHWMEPRDLDIRSLPKKINLLPGISSKHVRGACVALADGSVRFLNEETAAATLEALLTRNGGEAVDLDILQ